MQVEAVYGAPLTVSVGDVVPVQDINGLAETGKVVFAVWSGGTTPSTVVFTATPQPSGTELVVDFPGQLAGPSCARGAPLAGSVTRTLPSGCRQVPRRVKLGSCRIDGISRTQTTNRVAKSCRLSQPARSPRCRMHAERLWKSYVSRSSRSESECSTSSSEHSREERRRRETGVARDCRSQRRG